MYLRTLRNPRRGLGCPLPQRRTLGYGAGGSWDDGPPSLPLALPGVKAPDLLTPILSPLYNAKPNVQLSTFAKIQDWAGAELIKGTGISNGVALGGVAALMLIGVATRRK